MSEVIIDRAKLSDIKGLCEIGNKYTNFEVNSKVHFYESNELRQWSTDPSNNILLVASLNDEIIGFLFCKILSYHWALLDNFFVIQEFRKKGVAKLLFKELKNILLRRQISYISSNIEEDNIEALIAARSLGFNIQKKYYWVDCYISKE